MTKRIGRQWGPVQVHPQRQGVDTPEPAEWAAVAQPAQAGPAWVREVELWSGGQARLAARTVVVHWSAHNPWARVQQLGHQPLGELLFTWPDIVRGPVYAAHTPLGWARYGVYHRHAAPLLLLEVFLPALVQP